jgi:hypothetical protein
MLPRAKVSLLHVARAKLGLGEDDYRAILTRYGGAASARDLDARGFEAVLNRFRQLGFEAARRQQGYGDRFGMASDAQLELIRNLWAEVSGGLPEARLNAWLQHFGVSALRFATRKKAAKIIAGLRAWKARKAADASAS